MLTFTWRLRNLASRFTQSTYLLAFVVGEFDFISGRTDAGVEVKSPFNPYIPGRLLRLRVDLCCVAACARFFVFLMLTWEHGRVVDFFAREKVRVFTPLGKAEMGRHALDCSLRCLPFYQEKFGQPYPLPKLDLLAYVQMHTGPPT